MTMNDVYDEYPERSGCGRAFVAALAALGFVLLLFSLSGCKQVQTVVQTRLVQVHDTTRLTDSVYIDRHHYVQQKGDTVYITETVYKDRIKYTDRVQVVQKVDSIPYEVTVTEYVRHRNGYDRFTSAGFWILAALIVVVIGIRLWMRFYGLKR